MFSFERRSSIANIPDVAGQTLPYPIEPCPRIAIFSSHFVGSASAIRLESTGDLAQAQVSTVAAPLSTFRTIDTAVWKPTYPLIVLSRVDRGVMSDGDRDFLWHTFRVPVFEYLLDGNGLLIAKECEAHDGLHLHRGSNDVKGKIVIDPCGCGKFTPRLLRLDAIIEKSLSESAARQEWRNWQTHQT